MSTLPLPHCEQRSRSNQSCTVVAAPYRSAISAGSGSTWWWAIPAPHDEPQMRRGGAERHWGTMLGLQRRLWYRPFDGGSWWDAVPEERKQAMFKEFAAKTPVGRVGRPEDVAKAIVFLIGDDFITGHTLIWRWRIALHGVSQAGCTV
jgi:hypothetical protein